MSKIILKNSGDDLILERNGVEINVYETIMELGAAGHDYVEIGGLKWATKNVGATSVTDVGRYFAWGETEGYKYSEIPSKKYFDDDNYNPSTGRGYKFGKISYGAGNLGMTKYNNYDHKTVLELEDDAARANMGGLWRMPTDTEFQTLFSSTTTAWTNNYQSSGVAGLIFTDKTDNSKTLFFPVDGYAADGSVNDQIDKGFYWSSSLDVSEWMHGMSFQFLSGGDIITEQFRYIGNAVRGVLD